MTSNHAYHPEFCKAYLPLDHEAVAQALFGLFVRESHQLLKLMEAQEPHRAPRDACILCSVPHAKPPKARVRADSTPSLDWSAGAAAADRSKLKAFATVHRDLLAMLCEASLPSKEARTRLTRQRLPTLLSAKGRCQGVLQQAASAPEWEREDGKVPSPQLLMLQRTYPAASSRL